MSKYTTELRFICEKANNLEVSVGYNDTNTIIANARNKIFNFNYPIFDENYKSVLETKILKHFYTREICEETVGLWKLRLDTKLNEIMPYFNKLYKSELIKFNPLYTTNISKLSKNNTKSDRNSVEDITDNDTSSEVKNSISNNTKSSVNNLSGNSLNTTTDTNTGTITDNGTNGNNSSDLYSDTPQGDLTNVSNGDYLTNARFINENGTTNNTKTLNTTDTNIGNITTTQTNTDNTTTDNTSNDFYNKTSERGMNKDLKDNFNSTEDYLENVIGYSGANASELLLKYRETFLNIDMLIIKELDTLFIQLW